MIDRICEILSDVFNTEVTTTDRADTVEGWDSLSHLMMVLALEDKLGIRFHTDRIQNLVSVEEIHKEIAKMETV